LIEKDRYSGSGGLEPTRADPALNEADELLLVPFLGIGEVAANDRLEARVENILTGLAYIVFADVEIIPFRDRIFEFFLANITIQAFHVCLLRIGNI